VVRREVALGVVAVVWNGRRRILQRRDECPEPRLVQAGEGGVAERDEAVGLVTELEGSGLGGVERQGHLLEWTEKDQRATRSWSSESRIDLLPKVGV